jgi:hypothetical protein
MSAATPNAGEDEVTILARFLGNGDGPLSEEGARMIASSPLPCFPLHLPGGRVFLGIKRAIRTKSTCRFRSATAPGYSASDPRANA